MDILDHISKRIKELRLSHGGGKGISQEFLAKELGIAANTVSRWETGVYKPDIKELDKLARYFHTSILTFFPSETDTPLKKETAALMRAASTLDKSDLEELRRFAEFRQATRITKSIKGKKA